MFFMVVSRSIILLVVPRCTKIFTHTYIYIYIYIYTPRYIRYIVIYLYGLKVLEL